MKYLLLIMLLFAVGCGTYIGGDAGIVYNPDTFTGFRTPEYDIGVKGMKEKIEKMGMKAPVLPDNAVTIIGREELNQATGGLLKAVAPFAPLGSGFILLMISYFITRRKKEEEWKIYLNQENLD